MGFKFEKYGLGGSGGGDGTVVDVEALPTENIEQDKIYRVTEEAPPIIWLAMLHQVTGAPVSMSLEDYFIASGYSTATVPVYVVATLPDTMEPMDESTYRLPCYVLESTGVAYLSHDGTSASAMSIGAMFGAQDGGWVDSVNDITPSTTLTIYTIRPGSVISYGVPNSSDDKTIYEHDGTEWKEKLDPVDPVIKSLEITENGTYEVEEGVDGYAPIVVNVPDTLEACFDEEQIIIDVVLPTTRVLKSYMFQNNTSLKNVSAPNLIAIRSYAFSGCNALESAMLGDGLTTIGERAFYSCNNLALTSLPEGITSIGTSAFENCGNLALTSLPEGVTTIGERAFYSCNNLALTSLPEGITSIGTSAFEGCSGLTGKLTIPDGVTSLSSSAFSGCSGLTSITIPGSVTNIGYATFSGCSGLTSVTISEGVTSLGMHAFQNCSSLESIVLPNSVTEVLNGIFEGCAKLTNVTLSNKQTMVSGTMFNLCGSLTSITIPSSVTTMGMSCFADCGCLESITFMGTKAQWKSMTFKADWNKNTGSYIVTCTDGTIAKDGTET